MRQYLSSSLENVIGIERNVCSLSVQSNIKNHYSPVYNIILNYELEIKIKQKRE